MGAKHLSADRSAARIGQCLPAGVELVDTHCHLDVEDFDADRRAVIARARAAGVTCMVVPAIGRWNWEAVLALCAREPGLHPALGLHPVYADRHADDDVAALERALAERRPLAVGEIGLDFYIRDADRARQRRLFEAQLACARDAGLPVILHVRKAHDAVLALLRRIRVRGGIAHAFNGSLDQARRYLDLGFRLGFGGMVAYERSRRLRALAAALPAEAIVLETDAPDLAGPRHRGERNSPEYLPEYLEALAQVRGEAPADLAARTTANAREALGLP